MTLEHKETWARECWQDFCASHPLPFGFPRGPMGSETYLLFCRRPEISIVLQGYADELLALAPTPHRPRTPLLQRLLHLVAPLLGPRAAGSATPTEHARS